MNRRSITVAALVLTAGVASAAGGVDTKPFAEWSEKDADRIMTDSPWAGKATLTHARVGANLGRVPDWPIVVSVRSALPYKEAQLRKQLGRGGQATLDQTAALNAPEPLYVVAISAIPRMFAAQAAAIAKATLLKRPHKEALKAREARILLFDKSGKQVEAPPPPAQGAALPQPPAEDASPSPSARGGGAGGRGGFGAPSGGAGFGGFAEDKSGITATLFVGFSKDDPITVDEGEVELSTVISTYNVSKKFKLKDMTINGMLAF
jgi:hypothetical protein